MIGTKHYFRKWFFFLEGVGEREEIVGFVLFVCLLPLSQNVLDSVHLFHFFRALKGLMYSCQMSKEKCMLVKGFQ